MEYIVRPHPRFLPYARTGVGEARAVLVGSRHIAERTWDTLRIPDLEKRIFLGPPGVDIERFRPAKNAEVALGNLADAGERVLELPRLGYGPGQKVATDAFYDRVRTAARMDGMMGYPEVADEIAGMQTTYENDGIDSDAGDALRALAAAGDAPTVLYVGKLIVSKGVDLLAAAWPLVRKAHPDARLLMTGFGAYREGLEMLISALSEGDLVTARWIAEGGRAFEGGEAEPLKFVTGLLDSLEQDEDARAEYIEAARGMRDSITFVGRLEHELLSGVIPIADCQIVPSTFPEAYRDGRCRGRRLWRAADQRRALGPGRGHGQAARKALRCVRCAAQLPARSERSRAAGRPDSRRARAFSRSASRAVCAARADGRRELLMGPGGA